MCQWSSAVQQTDNKFCGTNKNHFLDNKTGVLSFEIPYFRGFAVFIVFMIHFQAWSEYNGHWAYTFDHSIKLFCKHLLLPIKQSINHLNWYHYSVTYRYWNWTIDWQNTSIDLRKLYYSGDKQYCSKAFKKWEINCAITVKHGSRKGFFGANEIFFGVWVGLLEW